MRIYLSIIFIASMMLNAMAQDQSIPLYQDTPPGNKTPNTGEVWSTSASGSAIVSNITTPELWFFGSDSGQPAPAIIICPGGGYRYQAYEHEGLQVAKWLSQLGYQAFVLKYRLPDESLFDNASTIPLTDARQAIVTIRKNASTLGVDSTKVGIMGFSAGGHLAASASTLFNHNLPYIKATPLARPDFSILMYPVISMTDSLTHKGSREALLGKHPDNKQVDLYSLEKQVTSETPPAFILHAEDDGSVPADNTKQYAGALRKANVPVQEIILPKGGHGFGFRKESPAFEWTVHLEKWLKNL
ncbi:alpha/beta hydrolase [Marinilabilia salmonicolor]|uniref:alpha/beta hydrolase n=1 Tax=Marinilabilia salmonicolor TaxID=989 RepID=UPI000469273D|nr:alpha/beta hydrolase [Marinilabilia salmonicolor]